LLDSDRLSKEDIQAILEAREAKEKEEKEKGAAELFTILDGQHSGMNRKFVFDMFGPAEDEGDREDDEPPAA
jgi:hypothetical protein